MRFRSLFAASLLVPGFLIFLLFPVSAFSASFSIFPSSGSFSAGERFVANISLTSDVSMNAASASISFPADVLSVESIQKGSVLNFWVVEPSFSNTSGRITFEGVSLSGFQGTNGSVVTVAFRAKKAGVALVAVELNQILANDGLGTDITGTSQAAQYSITPAVVAPPQKRETVPTVPLPVLDEPEQKEEPLDAPVLSVTTKGGVDMILGTSKYPHASAVITYTSETGAKLFSSVTADSNGVFSDAIPASLKDGTYAVIGSVVLDDGRQSPASEPILVPVGLFAGTIPVRYLSYLVFSLVTISALVLGYILQRGAFGTLHTTQELIHREVAEAKALVKTSFEVLKEDVEKSSHNADAGHGLSTENVNFVKELEEAEKVIEEKISDVDILSKKERKSDSGTVQ